FLNDSDIDYTKRVIYGEVGCSEEKGKYGVQELRRDEIVKNKINRVDYLRLELNKLSKCRADALEFFVKKNMKMDKKIKID
ncbi:21887_t:CDS:2, partial [Gigaspora rosea]